ncbi:hypothetical protein [Ktedonobacter robiniae]|uniref:hypothetical protein n=1 Tax=Ktedonobacter robiniae TaxID=2778365 RepID=UPI00191595B7|nr:hypothetical protein [Ktedonobacter robiniae]
MGTGFGAGGGCVGIGAGVGVGIGVNDGVGVGEGRGVGEGEGFRVGLMVTVALIWVLFFTGVACCPVHAIFWPAIGVTDGSLDP